MTPLNVATAVVQATKAISQAASMISPAYSEDDYRLFHATLAYKAQSEKSLPFEKCLTETLLLLQQTREAREGWQRIGTRVKQERLQASKRARGKRSEKTLKKNAPKGV